MPLIQYYHEVYKYGVTSGGSTLGQALYAVLLDTRPDLRSKLYPEVDPYFMEKPSDFQRFHDWLSANWNS